MRTSSGFFGLLALVYFALIVPASIGVFAQGATGTALVLTLGIAAPLTLLFIICEALTPTRRPNLEEAE